MTFVYYLATVRMPARVLAGSGMHRRFGAAGATLAFATVVWGVIVVGSPVSERQRKLDERRTGDLRTIEAAINRICLGPSESRAKGPPRELAKPLPTSLGEVAAGAVATRPPVRDSATGADYEYRVTGPSSFELCAVFDRARDEDGEARWNHPAGRHCFAFDLLEPR